MSAHGKHFLPLGDNSPIDLPHVGFRKFEPAAPTEITGTIKIIATEIIGDYHVITGINGPGAKGDMKTLYAVPNSSAAPFRPGAILDVKLKGVKEIPAPEDLRHDAPARLMVLDVI